MGEGEDFGLWEGLEGEGNGGGAPGRGGGTIGIVQRVEESHGNELGVSKD